MSPPGRPWVDQRPLVERTQYPKIVLGELFEHAKDLKLYVGVAGVPDSVDDEFAIDAASRRVTFLCGPSQYTV